MTINDSRVVVCAKLCLKDSLATFFFSMSHKCDFLSLTKKYELRRYCLSVYCNRCSVKDLRTEGHKLHAKAPLQISTVPHHIGA